MIQDVLLGYSGRRMVNSAAGDTIVLEQAALILQPALIRLVDQLRKYLERSDWRGTYETLEVWPEGTSPETQATVKELLQQMEGASPEQAASLQQALQPLPQPEFLYLLHLSKPDRQTQLNLWELCYQICFQDYQPCLERSQLVDMPLATVAIDPQLLDATGEVDWHYLDQKAQQIVVQAFNQL